MNTTKLASDGGPANVKDCLATWCDINPMQEKLESCVKWKET